MLSPLPARLPHAHLLLCAFYIYNLDALSSCLLPLGSHTGRARVGRKGLVGSNRKRFRVRAEVRRMLSCALERAAC
ncbi:hypothetical protein BDV93DRAFT_519387 [Ceratobasidium sp. AG-I]|nr:hypothetical protein BDV93DRAFT_519387 [Ceratobasidium sp. AG-I]